MSKFKAPIEFNNVCILGLIQSIKKYKDVENKSYNTLRDYYLNLPHTILVDEVLAFYYNYSEIYKEIFKRDFATSQEIYNEKIKEEVERTEYFIEKWQSLNAENHQLKQKLKNLEKPSIFSRFFGRKKNKL